MAILKKIIINDIKLKKITSPRLSGYTEKILLMISSWKKITSPRLSGYTEKNIINDIKLKKKRPAAIYYTEKKTPQSDKKWISNGSHLLGISQWFTKNIFLSWTFFQYSHLAAGEGTNFSFILQKTFFQYSHLAAGEEINFSFILSKVFFSV